MRGYPEVTRRRDVPERMRRLAPLVQNKKGLYQVEGANRSMWVPGSENIVYQYRGSALSITTLQDFGEVDPC